MTDNELNRRFDKLESLLASLVEGAEEREGPLTQTKTTVNVFDAQQVYTINDAAKKAAWSRTNIYKEMNAGTLPFVQHKNCRRLLGADLNTFLAKLHRRAETEE